MDRTTRLFNLRTLAFAASVICLAGPALAMPVYVPIGGGRAGCASRFNNCADKCENTTDPEGCKQLCAQIYLECVGSPAISQTLGNNPGQVPPNYGRRGTGSSRPIGHPPIVGSPFGVKAR
jgi:hypothetical protein